jgi:hypothetical protein
VSSENEGKREDGSEGERERERERRCGVYVSILRAVFAAMRDGFWLTFRVIVEDVVVFDEGGDAIGLFVDEEGEGEVEEGLEELGITSSSGIEIMIDEGVE